MDNEDRIFDFKRPPIMMIGSGISKRYVEDYPDWDGLLKSIAKRMGIDENRYRAYVLEAENNHDKQAMPHIASELSKELISKIKSGEIDPESFFTPDELKGYHSILDPINVLIASKLKTMKIKEDQQSRNELELFKSLSGLVPCVITTNYDLFLEKVIFMGYKVYSRVSDYYFSDAQEMGDIYKIHGSINYPSTMVVTSEGYDSYEKDSKIVLAKILSLLCDYPMVIMGYSMEDENVKGVLDDLIHCLEKEKLDEIEKNIIFVSYDENEPGLVRIPMNFPSRDKRMQITGVRTNNFEKVFSEISKIKPTVPIETIRKLRKLVKNIVLTTEPTGSRVEMLGFDEIDDISSDKLVLALASKEMVKKWKSGARVGLYTYTVDEMIKDIFSGDCRWDPKEVFEWFNNRPPNMRENGYVPIFHFIRDSNVSDRDFSDWTKVFIKRKRDQFKEMITGVEKIYPKHCELDIKTDTDLRQLLGDKKKRFTRSDIILYYYSRDCITEEEAENLLREFSGPCEKTSFRRAVTYLAFKDLGFDKKG